MSSFVNPLTQAPVDIPIGEQTKTIYRDDNADLIEHLTEELRKYTADGINGTRAVFHNRGQQFFQRVPERFSPKTKTALIDYCIKRLAAPLTINPFNSGVGDKINC